MTNFQQQKYAKRKCQDIKLQINVDIAYIAPQMIYSTLIIRLCWALKFICTIFYSSVIIFSFLVRTEPKRNRKFYEEQNAPCRQGQTPFHICFPYENDWQLVILEIQKENVWGFQDSEWLSKYAGRWWILKSREMETNRGVSGLSGVPTSPQLWRWLGRVST